MEFDDSIADLREYMTWTRMEQEPVPEPHDRGLVVLLNGKQGELKDMRSYSGEMEIPYEPNHY